MIYEKIKKYCCEDVSKIENYEQAMVDKAQVWECHHRLETHTFDGERRLVDLTYKELIALNMYYNRPASELIFMTCEDHNSLHHKNKKTSEETKLKMSIARKGMKFSKEHRDNISKALQGHTVSERAKQVAAEYNSIHHKGCHWYTDGVRNVFRKACPDGFRAGRTVS